MVLFLIITELEFQKINLDECLFASNGEGIKSVYPKLNLRNTGCAALDLVYVACGRLMVTFTMKLIYGMWLLENNN